MPSAAGQRLTSDGALVTLARPGGGIPAGSPFLAGWAHAPDGSAYIENAGAAVPGGAVYQRGAAFTPDGAAYYTTDAPGAGSVYLAGRAYRGDGAMHITSEIVVGAAYLAGIAHRPDGAIYAGAVGTYFDLPLADAGNGAVDIISGLYLGAPTFTRASPATTIGRDGLVLKGIAAAVARSCYDPTTLQYLGYFAEGQRSNICLQSEDFSTTWGNVRSTESVNATTAPDGTNTADKIIEDATAANTHYVSQSITFTAAIYTVSVWLKAGERTWARVQFNDGTTTVNCYFDLANGIVGTPGAGTGAIKAYRNGWYRCMVTSSAAMLAAVGDVRVMLATGDLVNTYNGDGVSGVYVWGAQVEPGAFASSYIPTLNAAVIREADSLIYPFSLDATKGVIYAELSTLWASVPTGLQAAAISFGTNIEYPLGAASTNASTRIRIRDGTNIGDRTGLLDLNTGVRKRAGSWGPLGIAVAGDGLVGAFVAFDGAMGGAAIGIGVEGDGAGSEWSGTIKNVRGSIIQPTAAQLQALTL